jgi:WD40 repeat protein
VGETLVLWDVRSEREEPHLDGHRDPVTWLTFTKDAAALISGVGPWQFPTEIIVWDLGSSKPLKQSDVGRSYPCSPDHLRWIQHDSRTGELIAKGKDLPDTPLQFSYVGANQEYEGFFSASRDVFAMPVTPLAPDAKVQTFALFDTRSGGKLGRISVPLFSDRVTFSSDSKMVAWYGENGSIELAAVSTGKHLRRLSHLEIK